MTEIHCPKCDIDFEGEQWESGSCPQCKRGYCFDEYPYTYDEDGETIYDYDIVIEWD